MSDDDDLVECVARAMAKDEGDEVMDHWRRRARAGIKALVRELLMRDFLRQGYERISEGS